MSTFKYESADLKLTNEKKGEVQLQFRGNFPFESAYMHDETQPCMSAMKFKEGGMAGILASSVLVARSYAFGLIAPMLSDVLFPGKSPDYDGMVTTHIQQQVTDLLNAIDEDNTVTKELRLGGKIVTGYTLVQLGYETGWCVCCGGCCTFGGHNQKLTDCRNQQDTVRMIGQARAFHARPTFTFRFYLDDPEKEIICRRVTDIPLDKKFYDFYHTGGRERRYLACMCIRICQGCGCKELGRCTCCSITCPFCCVRDRKKVHAHREQKVCAGAEARDGKMKMPYHVIMTPKNVCFE